MSGDDPKLTSTVIAPGSLFCSTLMAIQNKLYTVGLFYSLNARDTFATRNVTMDFTGNVSWPRRRKLTSSTTPSSRARRAPRPCTSTSRRRRTRR